MSIDTDVRHEHDGLCEHAKMANLERSGALELQELLDAGFEDDDLDAYAADNEGLRAALQMHRISTFAMERTINTGDPIARNIREILSKNKSSLIEPTMSQLVDAVLEQMSDKPTSGMLQAIVTAVSTGVALDTRIAGVTDRVSLESAVVNQFTAELISRIPLDNICKSFTSIGTREHSTDDPLVQGSIAAADLINRSFPQYPSINYNFLLNKQNYLMTGLNAAGTIHGMIRDIEPPQDFDRVEELSNASEEMAKQIGRIRSYGIKPMIFELGDEAAGRKAVYREPNEFLDDLGMSDLRDPHNSLANITVPTQGNDNPMDILLTHYNRLDGNKMQRMLLEGNESTYVVTRNGEIRAGVSTLNGTMNVRKMFELQGNTAGYELLRAKILSQIFDATAPAKIVDRLQADDAANTMIDGAEPRSKGDIVYDMVIRRTRYAKQPMRAIKKAFNDAIHEESEEAERLQRHLRLHDVTGHIRKIPSNALPSEMAIQNSKEAFGPDYELPEGYTFVKTHERGDISIGRVVGHTAVQGVVSAI